MLDWGYPESKDDDLTLKDYIVYMEEAIQTIIKTHSSFSLQSSSSSSSPSSTTEFSQIKISILGYCWGGLFSLIYSAINRHQTNINKLILMATPIDFNKDNTTVSMWSKSIDNNNKIIKTFGHFDGYLLDFVFNIRNPAKFLFGKYFNLWKHLDNKDFVNTFFDVEKWLHDTPPIPGKLYNKIINDCYRNNLLITENMRLEDNQTILGKGNGEENNNLIKINRITIPILSIIAENDTLVSPMSSLAINDHVASQEKKVIKHDGGYVSLCISENAHKEVWPRVASWIKS